MASLGLKQFYLNSKKKKKEKEKQISPSIFTCIRTLFLSFNLTGKPRTSKQSTKMQSNIKKSKNIKTYEI